MAKIGSSWANCDVQVETGWPDGQPPIGTDWPDEQPAVGTDWPVSGSVGTIWGDLLMPPEGEDWVGGGCCSSPLTRSVYATGLNLAESAYVPYHEKGKFFFQVGGDQYAGDADGFDGRVGESVAETIFAPSGFCNPVNSLGFLRGKHVYTTQDPLGRPPEMPAASGCYQWYYMIDDTIIGANENLSLPHDSVVNAALPFKHVQAIIPAQLSDDNPTFGELWVIVDHIEGRYCYRFTGTSKPAPYEFAELGTRPCGVATSGGFGGAYHAGYLVGSCLEPKGNYMWSIRDGEFQLKSVAVTHSPRKIVTNVMYSIKTIDANRHCIGCKTGQAFDVARNSFQVVTRNNCQE